ncbi:hypothetical protein [Neptunicella sp. SCSIO 80796]|uniref:hypothetical protein n=1 Tax=Neptunicella plasticusilytica TaxID=3117012 RepID=UPI003A4E2DE5
MIERMTRFITILGAIFLLAGCFDAIEEQTTIDGTPEDAVLNFFEAVYNKRDIDQVLYLSSARMKRLVKSYAAISNVQRHLLNLSYDKVNIALDTGNSKLRTQFSKNSRISVFFSGTYFDDKIEELRIATMIKEDGKWRVDRVEAGGFY